MRRLLLFLLLYSGYYIVHAQPSFKIEGCLSNFPYQKVLLSTLDGYSTVIDTAVVKDGCFEFKVSTDMQPGMYSIVLDKKSNAYIHFVYNHEDIEFKSDFKHLSDSMVFAKSVENRLFYRNVAFQTTYSRKLDLLGRIGTLYDKNSDFAKEITTERKSLKKDYESFTAQLLQEGNNTLYAKILHAQQPLSLPEQLSSAEQLKYTQLHALDNIDFGCEPLMRTDIITRFLPEYIALFKSNALTRVQQEDNYRVAVDRILAKCAVNDEMYKFVCQNLEQIFQYGEFDIISAYIKEKRIASGMCMSEQETADLKKNIEDIKRIAVGNAMPDMQISDISNRTFRLYDIISPYTLVVFWAASCSHCVAMMPALSKLYQAQKEKKLEVLAVSIDMVEQDMLSFLKTGNYNWINCHVKPENRNQMLAQYNVFGTPTFLLLDENKTIVSKPSSVADLQVELLKLNMSR